MTLNKSFHLSLLILIASTLFLSSQLRATPSDSRYIYESLNLNFTPEEQAEIKRLQTDETKVAWFSNTGNDKFILDSVSRAFGFNFKFVHFDLFRNAFNSVVNGDVSLIANTTYTDKRADLLSFSAPVNFDSCILYSDDNRILKHLHNKIIAAEKGTVWVQLAKDNFPKNKIVEVDGIEDAYRQFKNKKIDAIFANNQYYDYLVMNDLKATSLDDQINLVAGSIAGTKGKTNLLLSIISKYAQTEHYIQEFNDFNLSFYQKTDMAYLAKKRAELKIDSTKVYRVYLNELTPFSDLTQDGYVGIFPEIMEQLSNILGIKFQIVKSGPFKFSEQLDKELREDNIDIIMPLRAEAHNPNFYFSDVIYTENNLLIKRSDYKRKYTNVAELIYEKIGTYYRDSTDNYFFNDLYKNKKIARYDTHLTAIKKLKEKEVDFVAINEGTFHNYVLKTHDFSVRIASHIKAFNQVELALGFQHTKEGENLATIISIALRQINIPEIINAHIHEIDYENYYKKQNQIIYILLCICFVILICFIFLSKGLKRAIRTDKLCDILNRYALSQDYKKGITKHESILLFNIDHFKKFNETYGHLVGDNILKSFSNELNKYNKHHELKLKTYRVHSNEFIVIGNFKNKQINEHEIADHFLNQFLEASSSNLTYLITTSICIIPHAEKFNSIEEYLSTANLVMSDYKKSTAIKIELDELQFKLYESRLSFRRELEEAIQKQDLFSYFQPVVNIYTGRVVGIETLSRWKKDEKFVPVGLYMNEAKAMELESEIDQISLKWAATCYQSLLKEALSTDIYISSNISEQTLNMINAGMINLNAYNIPKEVLKIEILEDIVIDRDSINHVEKIIKQGYGIAIDDFGSGNTSLKYMKEPHFNCIKVDRSLVPTFSDESKGSITVFESQIKMLQELHKYIVVEGVETQEQIEYLRTLQVENVQGYYFSKPISLEELIKFIKDRNI